MSEGPTSCELIATAAFGVEASVKWELARLGYEAKGDQPGRLVFHADHAAVARANVFLRAADRVLMVVGRFEAAEFDALYAGISAIDWMGLTWEAASITVRVSVVRSPITSERAAQSIVKRAIVDAIVGKGAEMDESGEELVVDVSIIGTGVTVSLDTTGPGLHKRGYRERAQAGQLKETLAAGLVMICRWRRDVALVDPFCGSGTILIEAAMLASGRAPGRHRGFAAEGWPTIDPEVWAGARAEADRGVRDEGIAPIVGSDINPQSVGHARRCAENAGVAHLVRFELADYRELRATAERGWVITNPPYGVRVGEEEASRSIQADLPEVVSRMPGWSLGILMEGDEFERRVGREATQRRKLYNAKIMCTFYQYIAEEGRAAIGSRLEVANLEGFGAGLARRARHFRRWPEARDVWAYRLYEGEIAGIGLSIDRLGDVLRVTDLGGAGAASAGRMNRLETIAQAAGLALEVAPESVAVVHAGAGRSHTRAQGTVAVRERGVVYEVRPGDPREAGLELALREARAWAAGRAAGKRVLDVSARPGWLTEAVARVAAHVRAVTPDEHDEARLRRNLQLNGVGAERVEVVRGGALGAIDAAGEERWDLVLCVLGAEEAAEVAPAFEDVLGACAELLAPGGAALLALPTGVAGGVELGAAAREMTRSLHPEDVEARSGYRFWSARGPGAASD